MDVAIRTGTVNAGHTVYYKGKAYAMQQIPVSWVRPETMLVLGPGAYIQPDILFREIDWIAKAMYEGDHQPVLQRLFIDYRCGLHLPLHTKRSTEANRHHKMGATGKGCSEAVIDKIKGRGDGEPHTFFDWIHAHNGHDPWIERLKSRLINTITTINTMYDIGHTLLIEGTQGTLLDLHLGDYPYTTHKQTQVANWLAEAGLSANVRKEIWGVYRTMPIRVAGNSGPLPQELSWSRLAREINTVRPMVAAEALANWDMAKDQVWSECYPQTPSAEPANWTAKERFQHQEAASELHKVAFMRLADASRQELLKLFELTTVTKKLRRIGRWDWSSFYQSITLNRPDHLAITFMNYRFPQHWGLEDGSKVWQDPEMAKWLAQVVDMAQCPVSIASFGPQLEHTHMLGLED